MDKEGLRHRSRDQLKFDPLSRFDSSERRPAKHSSLIPAVSESVADDATNLLSEPNERDAGDRGNRYSPLKNISDQEGQTTDDQTTEDQTTEDQTTEVQTTEDQTTEDQTTEVQTTDDQTPEDQTPDDQTTDTLFNKFIKFLKWSCKSFDKIPEQTIGLIERVKWTVFVLLIFTVWSQIPLFIKSHESVDPFHYMRVTWASNRGTFMEFGIMPIVASRITLKMLDCFEIFNENDNSFSRNGAENWMFGEIESTGVVIISMQLFLAGLIIITLNDLVKKKYTLGTEISLFIVAKICGTIMWKAFSPVTVYTDQGAEYEGAFVFLLQLFLTKNDKTFILRRAFFRQNYPNLVNFLATFLVFFIVICSKKQQRGSNINPLFKSVAPLYLQSYCVPIFILFAKVLSAKLNGNFFVNLLGVWDDVRTDGLPHSYPIGGLCYYLIPPRTPLQVTQEPVYAVVYIIFMIASCVSCSMIMNDDGTTRHTAAVLSGLCIGALSVLADFLGVFGSGTRVILAAISIYNYAELINN